MFTKINHNLNLETTLGYHELKVKAGNGECLYAGNFLKDTELLSRKDKLFHLQRLNELNDRVARKNLHIFLTFHRSNVVDNDKLRMIGRDYMQEMGLHKQPFLIYRHIDTQNPHVHIVTTKIRNDGTPLNLKLHDYYKSNDIALKLEEKYDLVPPGIRLSKEEGRYPLQKVVYGVTPLRTTMETILSSVIPTYSYTTIAELNAILRPYNLRAYTGKTDSGRQKHKGLVYLVLDETGNRGLSYLKASVLYNKPTLKKLEKRFVENQPLREPHRQHLTTAIDWAFYKKSLSFEAFKKALAKEKISVVLQKDPRGSFQDIWYVDHRHKSVFDGSTLGSRYNAGDISRRCVSETTYQEQQLQTEKQQLRVRPRLDHF